MTAPSAAVPSIADERVLVLDFGSQYAQLIARRVREQQRLLRDRAARHHGRADPRARPERHHPLRRPVERLRSRRAEVRSRASFELGIPVLGICYGMQLACEALGGKVDNAPAREYGRAQLQITSHGDLVRRRAARLEVWMSHGDQVTRVSDDFVPLATTSTCPIAAVQAHDAAGLRPAVPSRSDAHAAGQPRCCDNFLTTRLRLHAARGSWATSPSETIDADPRAESATTA